MNATDRYKILANITAQLGTDNVDLYAELAKAEGMINLMDTQKAMTPPAPPPVAAPAPAPVTPANEQVQPI